MNCDHIGYRVYAKRIFKNKTIHYCIHCTNCGALVKQDGKPHIKLSEIPPNKKIFDFNEYLYNKLQGWV